jgi:hypothetical protein
MNKIKIIFLFLSNLLFAQVSADLTIENQQAVGTDFFFDIYLTRTGTNDVYLGTADFVLTFNSVAFTNPTVVRESPSFWNLTSTSNNPVGGNYRAATTPAAITGNEIVINLNQVSFGDQIEFDDFVARINNTPLTHRVGRYRVTGINNSSAFMNLQWKTTGTGLTTQVFTLGNISPWSSQQITINAINPGSAPLPVELTSFTASYKNSAVMLNWKTETEMNNYGFNVERRVSEGNWDSIAFIEGHGNSNSPKEYSYIDKDLFAGGSSFQYRLKQIDSDGSFEYSDVVEVEVVPDQYALSQNYPNPFNPSTTIQFSLPKQTHLKINLYNMLGEQVATLAEGMFESGYHKVTFNTSNLPSGTYIYRLESSDFVQVKKMILMK